MEDGTLVIEAELTDAVSPRLAGCLFCPTQTVRNGFRKVRFRDAERAGRHVALEVKRQQYRCKSCGTIAYTPAPGCIEGRKMTERFRRLVLRMAIKQPFRQTGEWFDLSEATVRSLFGDYVDEKLRDYAFPLPEVMGIDEKYIYDEPTFVIGDVKNSLLLDIKDGNAPEKVLSYFRDRTDRDNVKLITMDMSGSYRKNITALFPGVPIISDKWHVLNLANRALTRARAAYSKTLDSKEGRRVKGNLGLFDERYHTLKAKPREKLDNLLTEHPFLADAYWAKERFYDVYAAKDRAEAQQTYDRWWRDCVPNTVRCHFRPINKQVVSWSDAVFAYFDNRYTNAYVESTNRALADLSREGRGYSFEVLRAKALLTKNLLKVVSDEPDWFRGAFMRMTDENGNQVLPDFPKRPMGVRLDELTSALTSRFEIVRRGPNGYYSDPQPSGLSSMRIDGLEG